MEITLLNNLFGYVYFLFYKNHVKVETLTEIFGSVRNDNSV